MSKLADNKTQRRRCEQPAPRRRSGFVMMEVLLSVGLVTVLVAFFAVAVLQYAGVRRENDTRRMLRLAAAAELERVRAGLRDVEIGQPGRPPASEPGEIALSTTATLGREPWEGLTLVRVVASKRMAGERRIAVELAAYIDTKGTPP